MQVCESLSRHDKMFPSQFFFSFFKSVLGDIKRGFFKKESVAVPVEKKKENLYNVIVASLPKHISFKLPRNGRNPLESVFSSLNFKQNCRKKPFYTVSNVSLKHRRRVSTIMCSVQFFFKENIPVEVNTLLWGDNSRAKPTSCSCSRKAQKYRLKMW